MTAHVGRAWLVVLGGVAAAVHVGKLPPALPVLRDALGLTLVEAGFLLSLVQVAGMALGVIAGLAADAAGLRRTMLAGLVLSGLASLAGGWATSPAALLALRAVEGLGFLLASMPAPALIRRLVPRERMSAMLGVWGAYMPFATAAALLCGPLVIGALGWPGWWWLLGTLSLVAALALGVVLPPDAPRIGVAGVGWRTRIADTVRAPGPWIVALAFGVYSAQWLAVIGFLPSIYHAAGMAAATAAWATAVAAAVNMTGNLASGKLLQHGVRPARLLATGFIAMAAGATIAFAPLLGEGGASAWARYGAVLVFSAVGGLIPGTLFSLAVRAAPGEHAIATTVGWMQQWSAFGQFGGPPLVAWVAGRVGGWSWSWAVTGAFALLGLLLAFIVSRMPRLGRAAA